MSSKNRNQQKSSTGTAGPKPEAKAPEQQEQQQQQSAEALASQDQAQQQAGEQSQQSGAEQATAQEKPAEAIAETKPAEAAAPAVAQPKASVSQHQKGFKPVYKVELELTGYAEAMDKKNVMVPEVGGKWQLALFKAIKNVFNAPTQEAFNSEFNTVLSFFNKNKDGIFNEKFIFRFPENWPGSPNEYTQNRRLIYLIIQTADPKNRRKALDEINMEMVAEGLTEPQKQMLFNFYQM